MFANKPCPLCGAESRGFSPAWFRRQRQRNGFTLREVARGMGISLQYLCDLEHERRDWNRTLADLFKTSVSALQAQRRVTEKAS